MIELEYRMYGFVPYNLSEIQKGIQFGHAVVEYGQNAKGCKTEEAIYNKWANHDKTFIILNGGTTNTNLDRLGSLNEYRQIISDANILYASFFEPDLGDQLTAFVFLVDERVWNKEKYPDYVPPFMNNPNGEPTLKEFLDWEEVNSKQYDEWIESIGGEQNLFLRTFLKDKRLA